MTDETTARDRAIERIAESIDWQPTCLPGNERRTIVRQVLDMAEHPRALAGAPTADVAEDVVERVARKLHETSEMRQYTWDRAGASRRHGHWHDVMRARAREVLAAAAPEGAPTPDVAIVQAARAWKAKRDQLQYPPPPTRVDDLDVQNTSLPEARALYEAVAAAPEGVDAAPGGYPHGEDPITMGHYAAPEGVDAADELRIAREQYSSTLAELERVHDSREQVYRERDEACTQRTAAQGELHRRNVEAKSATIRATGLADDLTAAQAAIQRVREEHRPTHDGYCVVCASWDPITGASGVPWPCPTKVALDGDTTEEGA